jgi:23S rRNA (uracil1939-C5)-methyltransferase
VALRDSRERSRSLVEISGIAAGGAGVGRLEDGCAVFVPGSAPGELVEVRVRERKPRWARADLVAVRRASPERRTAPCTYYGRCGGCTLEHLDYDAQLRAKARLVADAVGRIGGVEVTEPEIVASPEQLRYRNRVSFTLLRLGMGRVVAGFHEPGRPGRLVDVGGDCLLPEPAVAEAWSELRQAWGPDAQRLPAGQRLRLTLRGTATGEVTLLVENGTTAGRPAELLARVQRLRSIWLRRRAGDEPELLGGAPSVVERWGEETLELSAGTFLQVNRRAAERLESYVLALAGDVVGLRVIDAYCGVGLHGRRLARAGARVEGIELDPLAVRQARTDAPANAVFHEGTVERLLPEMLPSDLVIVNPPRAGLDGDVTAALREKPASRLIYVSCGPATLARDIGRLGDRYRLESLRCFDLFPQTDHVETVAELVCAIS